MDIEGFLGLSIICDSILLLHLVEGKNVGKRALVKPNSLVVAWDSRGQVGP